MSLPNEKSELHELVSDFVRDSCGEENLVHYLHAEIDYPNKRSWLYDQFQEYVMGLSS